MPISVKCPQCQTTVNVKDEFAGRKFRCKTCGSAVTVPQAAGSDDDEWGDDDLEGGEPLDQGEALPRPKRRKSSGGRSRRSSGGGMPTPVVIAIVCECLLILFNLLSIAGNLMSSNIGGACGAGFRILIEGAAILGYVQRQNVARWIAIVLSWMAVVALTICSGVLLMGGQQLSNQINAQLGESGVLIVVAIIMVQVLITGTIAICLHTRSAADHFDS
ncbi:MAG: hypothetical protein R3B90_21920 [Planctomycetaceae bacterium]